MTLLAPVFATTYPYAMCKMMGERLYKTWEAEQIASGETLSRSELQAFRTLGALARVVETFDLVVEASTYITRARSVMTGKFLRSARDVWVTVDDDIETDEDVLWRLVTACRATRDVVAAPYLNRDGKTATFGRVHGPVRHIEGGIALRHVDRIGMGCVALHRDLIETLAASAPYFRESNKEQKTTPDCPALFLEGVYEGDWVGEDYFFSALCEKAGRPIHVLLDAIVTHQHWTTRMGEDGVVYLLDDEPPTRNEGKPCLSPESQGQ